VRHKGEKTQPADKDAGSQSPWLAGGRALVASTNHREAHVSCNGPPSSKMCVSAVRM
jgi:hypothetical protein